MKNSFYRSPSPWAYCQINDGFGRRLGVWIGAVDITSVGGPAPRALPRGAATIAEPLARAERILKRWKKNSLPFVHSLISEEYVPPASNKRQMLLECSIESSEYELSYTSPIELRIESIFDYLVHASGLLRNGNNTYTFLYDVPCFGALGIRWKQQSPRSLLDLEESSI
uniref:Uncharacterized protein n=1 Tax=Setaria viridis TaxID=4556 RepID=A0A4U6UUF5_SETVI|nr:hypothetical protein SEVIR_4G063102v2 [Setaria viridis]